MQVPTQDDYYMFKKGGKVKKKRNQRVHQKQKQKQSVNIRIGGIEGRTEKEQKDQKESRYIPQPIYIPSGPTLQVPAPVSVQAPVPNRIAEIDQLKQLISKLVEQQPLNISSEDKINKQIEASKQLIGKLNEQPLNTEDLDEFKMQITGETQAANKNKLEDDIYKEQMNEYDKQYTLKDLQNIAKQNKIPYSSKSGTEKLSKNALLETLIMSGVLPV